MKKLLIFFVLIFSAAAQSATHSNTLTWVAGTGGDPATGFEVQRSSANSGPWTTIGSTTISVLTYTDTTVSAGQTWFYQIIATNPGGSSLPSNIVSATTPFLPPAAPGNLQNIPK